MREKSQKVSLRKLLRGMVTGKGLLRLVVMTEKKIHWLVFIHYFRLLESMLSFGLL